MRRYTNSPIVDGSCRSIACKYAEWITLTIHAALRYVLKTWDKDRPPTRGAGATFVQLGY